MNDLISVVMVVLIVLSCAQIWTIFAMARDRKKNKAARDCKTIQDLNELQAQLDAKRRQLMAENSENSKK